MTGEIITHTPAQPKQRRNENGSLSAAGGTRRTQSSSFSAVLSRHEEERDEAVLASRHEKAPPCLSEASLGNVRANRVAETGASLRFARGFVLPTHENSPRIFVERRIPEAQGIPVFRRTQESGA
jgi:hypothetical protein